MLEAATEHNETDDTHEQHYDQSYQTSYGQIKLILDNGYVSRDNILYGKAGIVILKDKITLGMLIRIIMFNTTFK